MYQLHFKPTTGRYCLRRGDVRTHWLSSASEALTAPLNSPTSNHISTERVLLYEGPTVPTIDTHPELFI